MVPTAKCQPKSMEPNTAGLRLPYPLEQSRTVDKWQRLGAPVGPTHLSASSMEYKTMYYISTLHSMISGRCKKCGSSSKRFIGFAFHGVHACVSVWPTFSTAQSLKYNLGVGTASFPFFSFS